MAYRIEKLKRSHDRKRFDCGVDRVNQYLQKVARQQNDDSESGTIVYCLVDDSQPKTILGFFSLHSTRESLNPVLKKASTKAVGCLLVGWLGVDKDAQSMGIGKVLIHDIFIKFIDYDQMFAAIILDAITDDDRLIKFYKRMGFRTLTDNRYFVTLKTVWATLSEND
ncbi:hypothetical protein AVI51_07415 [Piscirickettsia salmonis]|uniref:Acetyltransferase (GNAT) family protein n=1 Tax=Piscirickettsia salmonis TaxID=1238 RepID=A0A9Q6LRM7_PISSA|nr:GNAT family N-acetyltransferase [Piscirickettsia salmonis]RNC76829.1 GNAT family N-acetyltransferase [Piscirickettsiaceae bacterium NZ-RLO2]ALA25905.1 acetyltransferase family protein [Piscirickettsia salmonis]APS43375.1 hypothetical protein AVI48_02625 [Piscirickettsia salmonis]APS46726.1 hypothetical protein AVI49_03230 [Piscirickettsia salmonis]APS50699.1 hypothetical protein AVI50_07500 [Piscirickettsia salmonis]